LNPFILPWSKPRSILKSLKEKLLNTVTAHPKLVTLGIGLAVTFAIGTAIGMVELHNLAYANGGNGNSGSANGGPN
jgi:hypothetical protein